MNAKALPVKRGGFFMSGLLRYWRHAIAIVLLGAGSTAFAQSNPASATDIAAIDAQCTGGDVEACDTLIKRYRYGQGVAKDPARAAQIELRACKAGDGKSCEYYGVMMKTKRPGYPAYDSAIYADMMKRACLAQTRANCRSANGIANNQAVYTAAERAAIYKQVCATGSASSCNKAAYAEGEKGNWANALSLARTACSRGNSNACANVAAYQARADNARRAQQRSARRAAPTYTERPVQQTTSAPAGRTFKGNSNARSGTRACTKSNGGKGNQYWYYGFDNRKKYGPCI